MITKTGAFCDDHCTCQKCGNTHELYGGKGYEDTLNEFHPGELGDGTYIHEMKCNVCGAISTFIDKD